MNGLLSVDIITGEEYLILKERAKTEDIATYMTSLCDDCFASGYTKLTVILDNNSTHKKKMQYLLKELLKELDIQDKIEVEFIYTPPYSPDFNLAEYVIHLLRLKFLHHLPLGITIDKIKEKLEIYFQNNHIQTPQQIQNILHHIFSLVK